ncbi:MAG: ABC transporter ATP-binding protein [Chloroflexi bacterium HGW-Chloroflexi-4]|jgi:ABC-2 type transport system ATP-binding protein|nr:MAG: ABC transporter ATP-binding protein [Chloroflexi bacterium HGW-Chloroflexi-4]
MNNSVIQINNLTRTFGENKAVGSLSLEVNAGEIFGFLGHNGAGKTTTVRLLNGIYSPSSGSSQVLGIDPQKDGPALRAQTGVLTETPSLDERLSGYDLLAYYADLFTIPKDTVNDRIMSLLTEFGLEKRAKDKVGTYSKGMKQSLALARALLHKPKVLFLDEPTSSLDPVAARHVNDLIERLTRREGCTVFLCTHNLVEAQKLCDRVAVMQHGQLKALGTPADLTRQYIKRQNIELEVEENQIEKTNQILVSHPDLVLRTPVLEKNMLLVTVSGRDAIPEILTLLTVNNISVYRLNPQEVNLEEVYFALNGESK